MRIQKLTIFGQFNACSGIRQRHKRHKLKLHNSEESLKRFTSSYLQFFLAPFPLQTICLFVYTFLSISHAYNTHKNYIINTRTLPSQTKKKWPQRRSPPPTNPEFLAVAHQVLDQRKVNKVLNDMRKLSIRQVQLALVYIALTNDHVAVPHRINSDHNLNQATEQVRNNWQLIHSKESN